jgi:hypothetical protein
MQDQLRFSQKTVRIAAPISTFGWDAGASSMAIRSLSSFIEALCPVSIAPQEQYGSPQLI